MTAASEVFSLRAKRVLIVSPHFDDVALSLGQSLRDGDLSQASSVSVRVVFGATNWTTSMHPTRRRAPFVSAWRRTEELMAALRFGYTFRAAALEEVVLRSGSMDPGSFRDEESISGHPLVDRVTRMIRRWSDDRDLVLVPAGLGRHVDHRIVAAAGVRLMRAGGTPVAFYEDRPYTAYLDDAAIAGELAELGLELHSREVSGPISEDTQRTVRRIYRSQMDDFFVDAQRRDRDQGTCERIWVPE